jgi:small subunit ribosomal protein S7
MIDGKKSKSHKIITNTLCRIGAQHGDVITFLMKAIDNVKPIIEVRKIRISGSTILVPCIISRNRQESLAIRWIVEAAKKRRNTKKSMSLDQCLYSELIDASQKIGAVRKKRDDLHKLAESNRGFAHYRWW